MKIGQSIHFFVLNFIPGSVLNELKQHPHHDNESCKVSNKSSNVRSSLSLLYLHGDKKRIIVPISTIRILLATSWFGEFQTHWGKLNLIDGQLLYG